MDKDNGWKNERAISPNFSLQFFLETKKKKKKELLLPIFSIKRTNISLKITTHENHCNFTTPLHEISLKSLRFHCSCFILTSKKCMKSQLHENVSITKISLEKRQSRDVVPTYFHHMKSFELPLPLTPLCGPLASIAHTKVLPWNQNMHNLRRKQSLEVVQTLFLVVNKSNLSNLKPN